ncbi:MAG: NAD+ synthase [Candidatus Thorarchaeota archaeon]|jgi:NAD+ synthase
MHLPQGLVLDSYEAPKQKIVKFIHDYVSQSGAEGVVLGLSGGVDSALVASLSVEALGAESVFGMIMPIEVEQDSDNAEDALKHAESLGMSSKTFELKPLLEPFKPLKLDSLCLGNLKARLRMITLYTRANQDNLLVIGTGNKSEIMTGYFTKYGDGGVDFLPIADLYKTDVWNLSELVGIPKPIIEKAPSAGLWPNQTDEDDLGVTYAELDSILFLKYEKGFDFDQIVTWGIEKHKVKRVFDLIQKSQHKRNPLPKVLIR